MIKYRYEVGDKVRFRDAYDLVNLTTVNLDTAVRISGETATVVSVGLGTVVVQFNSVVTSNEAVTEEGLSPIDLHNCDYFFQLTTTHDGSSIASRVVEGMEWEEGSWVYIKSLEATEPEWHINRYMEGQVGKVGRISGIGNPSIPCITLSDHYNYHKDDLILVPSFEGVSDGCELPDEIKEQLGVGTSEGVPDETSEDIVLSVSRTTEGGVGRGSSRISDMLREAMTIPSMSRGVTRWEEPPSPSTPPTSGLFRPKKEKKAPKEFELRDVRSSCGLDGGRGVDGWYAQNSGIALNEMPQCCTALIMSGFGGSGVAYRDGRELKKDTLVRHIKAWVNWVKTNKNQSILIANVTSEQEEAVKALRAAGFEETLPAINPKYPDTCLYTFVCNIYGSDEEYNI